MLVQRNCNSGIGVSKLRRIAQPSYCRLSDLVENLNNRRQNDMIKSEILKGVTENAGSEK